MSQGRKDLLTILSSTQTYSIFYWVTLLNLFDEYKDEFNISDMRLLVAECEDIREWFNDNNTDTIRQEDTRPNIYVHLKELEATEYKKRIIIDNTESLPTTQLVAVA